MLGMGRFSIKGLVSSRIVRNYCSAFFIERIGSLNIFSHSALHTVCCVARRSFSYSYCSQNPFVAGIFEGIPIPSENGKLADSCPYTWSFHPRYMPSAEPYTPLRMSYDRTSSSARRSLYEPEPSSVNCKVETSIIVNASARPPRLAGLPTVGTCNYRYTGI